jgi:predicted nucleotidyltransferase component of viral defense system
MQLSEIQTVEYFHLLFLAQLGARLDKKLYALKGGCNLRFFWKSIRYSEDIDFDAHTTAKHTLKKNVEAILQAPGFSRILRSSKIQLLRFSAFKQTDTTQRWKVHLQSETSGVDLPTKIEFSRRKVDSGVVFGPADPEILHAYHLRPTLASHYDLEASFAQKVEALLGRKETQTRDIFDLAFLSERGATGSRLAADQEKLAKAREIVLAAPFDQFRSQVVAFLPPEHQGYYGTPDAWHSLRQNLARKLQRS